MPLLLTGEIGNFNTTGDPTFATGTVPTNGDDVDAPVVATLVKRLLDFDAQLASDLDAANTQLLQRFTDGPSFLRTVASIADLKAVNTTGMTDGSIRVLKDPTITGSDVTAIGLYVYDSSATSLECAIPGLTDAYLVVTPNTGSGRWFNVAAGVGWKIGATPEFLPKPRERVIPWQISGDVQSQTTVTLAGATWTQLPPVVAPVLGASDVFDFDFDFCCGFANYDDTFGFRVEVSYNGGSYTYIPGTNRQVGILTDGSVVPRYTPIHISGRHTASSGAGTYTYRVKCNTSGTGDALFWQTWTARGVQYVVT